MYKSKPPALVESTLTIAIIFDPNPTRALSLSFSLIAFLLSSINETIIHTIVLPFSHCCFLSRFSFAQRNHRPCLHLVSESPSSFAPNSTPIETTMQHPRPDGIYPEFLPQPDRPTTVSATQNPYALPTVMDPRFLAHPASALSQHCPPYFGSAPSGPLTGIAHHPMMGFAQGNNYIGVVNIESPTRPRQSKKRKRDDDTVTAPSQRRKGKS